MITKRKKRPFYSPCIFNNKNPNTNPKIIKIKLITDVVKISLSIIYIFHPYNIKNKKLKTISTPYNCCNRKSYYSK